MKKKLSIIVPTANREAAIDNWLKETSKDANMYGIDLIIYDGSSNDKTKDVVQKYKSQGNKNVIYSKYDGFFDGFSLDHKIIAAYEEYAADYEYIWIIRDGLIPCIDSFYNRLNDYMSEGYPCIIVDADFRNFYANKEVFYGDIRKDYEKFLTEQAHRLQTLGMLIFSSEFALDLIKHVPLDDKVYSLWQMAAPFHFYVRKSFKVVFYVGRTFVGNREGHKGHFWQSGEKLFKQWGERWCNVIDNLPSEYDNAKNKVIKLYTYDFHPFSPIIIAELRAYSNFNYRIVCKYEECIKRVSNTPIKFIKFVSLTPKWFWKLILKYDESLFAVLLWNIYLYKVREYPVEGKIMM